MKIIKPGKIPIKMWLDDLEESALTQAENLSNLPFAFRHIAIMPDSHMGFGMPIGGVLATKDVIIPNAVGVDIGCGMIAQPIILDETDITKEQLIQVVNKIKKRIPVGMNWQKKRKLPCDMPYHEKFDEDIQENFLEDYFPNPDEVLPVVTKQYDRARYQLGTLGGGNHFIEIQKSKSGRVWIMIHSGSRNLGKQVADEYNKIAIKLNEKYFSAIPKEWELAYLPADSPEAHSYLEEMDYCVEFARKNREVMLQEVLKAFSEVFGGSVAASQLTPPINIAHNYVNLEEHFGEQVWVHRKGATSAREGEKGIIPGSQGTKSYIVTGLGNPESFQSCSHGAGRKMGRKAAQRSLNLEDEKNILDSQGIIHGIETVKDLDEASGAYKDIDVVMENQKDLVKIVEELTPIAVIKG